MGNMSGITVYRNEWRAGEWNFKDVTERWGLESLPPTYQASWADFDRDGRMDLVTAGRLYANTGAPGTPVAHWLELQMIGDGVRINRQAIGAQARITLPDGRVLARQVEAGTGEGNSNSPILHFGLGVFAGPVTIAVTWPEGNAQLVAGVSADQLIRIDCPR